MSGWTHREIDAHDRYNRGIAYQRADLALLNDAISCARSDYARDAFEDMRRRLEERGHKGRLTARQRAWAQDVANGSERNR